MELIQRDIDKYPDYQLMQENRDALNILSEAWKLLKDEPIIHPEKVIIANLEGVNWVAKPDSILKDNKGHWIGELKTTMRFGDSTRRLYYKELQPWLYLVIASITHPEFNPFQGVKMYIAALKGGVPIEEIGITPERIESVWEYVRFANFRYAEFKDKLENGKPFWKNRTKCSNLFGECPYYALCEKGVEEKKDYLEMLLTSYYTIKDPYAHLEE